MCTEMLCKCYGVSDVMCGEVLCGDVTCSVVICTHTYIVLWVLWD